MKALPLRRENGDQRAGAGNLVMINGRRVLGARKRVAHPARRSNSFSPTTNFTRRSKIAWQLS